LVRTSEVVTSIIKYFIIKLFLAYETNKDIKPMDEETKKWLLEALQEGS
jgi:hypothetical protein